MDRRNFLQKSGLAFSTAALVPITFSSCTSEATTPLMAGTWDSIRAQFNLKHDHLQMSQMLLASHPKRVRDAIEKHRNFLDENPALYWEEHWLNQEQVVCDAAAKYMKVDPEEIVLTDSTTQGLSLLFNGLKLKPGDEIIATTHDHYVTDKSIDYACEKKGCTVRRINEYNDPSSLTVEEVTSNIANAISDKTRVVMVTWVQSCTGVKLPIKDIGDVIAEANITRDSDNRIYFCVDGVHGFGNQDEDISSLGCDFFVAGTHKWIFGPRGTGLLWGKRNAWQMVAPTVPAFSWNPFMAWMDRPLQGEMTFADLITPGGFHAFEHRWSLNEAFEFQMEIGRDKVHQRTTELNTRLKEGISHMGHVKLHTPVDPGLSAGINCFEVEGLTADETVKRFHDKGIIASASPYKVSYARLTPCIINTENEIDACIKALEGIRA